MTYDFTITMMFPIVTSAIAVLTILFLINVRYDRTVKKIWVSLKSEPSNTIFTKNMVANLDEPVQKYFLHAIKLGTPIAAGVELEMSGSFRLKPDADWIPMQASEIISQSPGFVWKAKVGKGLGELRSADYYSKGKGKMRFSIWGLIPVVNAQNDNITRSSIGRLGCESIWLPSALLPQNGVIWKAVADNTIQANWKIDNESITLTLTIDADGKVLKLSLLRWGDKTEDGSWQYIPFGGEVKAEKTFAGYTVPSAISAGWWFGTDKHWAFFQPIIEQAKFS